MKKFRLLFAAILLLGQLPVAALAASVQPAGPTLLSAEIQQSVTGGVCSTCNDDPDPPGNPPAPPSTVGSPYWEHTNTTRIAHTQTPGNLVFHYNNHSTVPVTRTVSYTKREALSWQVGGGIPAGVIRAQIGATYENVTTESHAVVIPGRISYKVYIGYDTIRNHNRFTRWQDYSDGSRSAVGSGTVPSSHLSTRYGAVTNPL